MKRLSVRACCVSSAMFFALVLLSAGAQITCGDERPNILFIMTDQQSADVMSCRMGRQHIHTPAMDELARTGMLFSRAYTANPLCMPARSSIFTGRYPHETRVTKNARPEGGLDPEFVSMGVYFQSAGYTTAYCGKTHLCFSKDDNNPLGFERLKTRGIKVPPQDDNFDGRITHVAVQFLKKKQEKPFLLVVSYMNPHNICEWARRGAGRKQTLSCGEIGTPPAVDRLPPPPANLEVPKNEPDGMLFLRRAYQVEAGSFPVGNFSPEDWRRQRWGYYRMVEKVDAEIGRVMDALRRAGLEEKTLVIFTSDHGDCVGAHRFNQKTVFYEESVRIPLIVSWKGKTAAGTSDALVNTGIDILPTMFNAAQIRQPEKLTGRSVLPVSLGEPAGKWREYIVSQNNMSQTGTVDGIRPTMEGRMVRTDQYKYCVYAHGTRREALYDLINDPLETVNLAVEPRHRKTLLHHRALLAEFARTHNDKLAKEILANDVAPRPFGKK